MPNLLTMANVQSILLLHAQGRSQREIARTLDLDRGTVRKYLLAELSASKPAGTRPGYPLQNPPHRVRGRIQLQNRHRADRLGFAAVGFFSRIGAAASEPARASASRIAK